MCVESWWINCWLDPISSQAQTGFSLVGLSSQAYGQAINSRFTNSTIAVLVLGGIGLLVVVGGLLPSGRLLSQNAANLKEVQRTKSELEQQFLELKAKAEKGDPAAQNTVGSWYRNGRGVGMDWLEAANWYRKAAEQGFAEAQVNLSECYSADPAQAKMMNIRTVVPNQAEAQKWLSKALDQNYDRAQALMGGRYLYGYLVERDQVEAVAWFRKAAAQNNVEGQLHLGHCYARGWGVAKDQDEAVRWFRKAAAQNDIAAQTALAGCYANGDGVPKDWVEAYAWLNLAPTNQIYVLQNRDRHAKTMSTEQIAAGNKRTAELRAQIEEKRKSGGK